MNCWEFKKCSQETRTHCPTYPENGKRCWKVTETKCDAGRLELATQQEKVIFCRKCEFYKTYADRF
ncbi:MAG: hypothetical protein WA140_04060 [Geobacteraceae bacterium]